MRRRGIADLLRARRLGFPAAPGPAFRGALLCVCLLLPFQGVAASPVRMEVRRVVMDPANRTPVVVLAGEGRLLPIWIGAAEAASIALALEGKPLPRPNTHDMVRNLLQGLDAALERVTITELRDDTYFAVITLKAGQRRIPVDSRPSDAIAVALRTGAPIYATAQVLSGSVPLDDAERPQGFTRRMGMHLQDLTEELGKLFATALREGVLVSHVESGSPASDLGFRRGDVIVGVGPDSVRNTRELEAVLRSPARHDFRIRRDGEPVTIVMSPPSQAEP